MATAMRAVRWKDKRQRQYPPSFLRGTVTELTPRHDPNQGSGIKQRQVLCNLVSLTHICTYFLVGIGFDTRQFPLLKRVDNTGMRTAASGVHVLIIETWHLDSAARECSKYLGGTVKYYTFCSQECSAALRSVLYLVISM